MDNGSITFIGISFTEANWIMDLASEPLLKQQVFFFHELETKMNKAKGEVAVVK